MLLIGTNDLIFHTTGELENLVETVAFGRMLQADTRGKRPTFRSRSFLGDTASLFYLASSFPSAFEFEPVDYLRFVFQLEHSVDVRIGSTEFSIDPRQAGYVVPPGQKSRKVYHENYRTLALRITTERLQSLASSMLGQAIDHPIVFEQPDPQNTAFSDFVRGAVVTAAREFNNIAQPFQAIYWETFEANIATRILLHGQHSLSHLFQRSATSGGRMERVEDYIREHWNEPLHVEKLAEIAGTSMKTVYSDFLRRYEQTPHGFIRQLRLRNARDMLLMDPPPSAMLVALKCGFTSLGHFARAYRSMFGELPSTTAKRRRS